jgi:hypothetical protein
MHGKHCRALIYRQIRSEITALAERGIAAKSNYLSNSSYFIYSYVIDSTGLTG